MLFCPDSHTNPTHACKAAPFSCKRALLQGGKRCESLSDTFGPVHAQVLTEYSDEQLPLVLEALEKLEAHLTAAVVSNDPVFTQKVTACSGAATSVVMQPMPLLGASNHALVAGASCYQQAL